MIASRIARADTRFGPTRFSGSSPAMIGPAIAHSSSGTRQIGGSGSRFFLALAIPHLLLTRRCSPHAGLEIVTYYSALVLVRESEGLEMEAVRIPEEAVEVDGEGVSGELAVQAGTEAVERVSVVLLDVQEVGELA